MPLTAKVQAGIEAEYTPTASPELGQVTKQKIPKFADIAFASGTADYQSDILWADERTLTTGATEDLDLFGILSTAFGATVSAVEVTAVAIASKRNASNTTNLTVGNATAPAQLWFGSATHTAVIQPEGRLLHCAPKSGWTITPTTGDVLKIANAAGASHVYQIVIMARSA